MKRKESKMSTVTLPETGFVRQAQLVGDRKKTITPIIPFSATTLWRKIARNEFPAPVKLSEGITAWRVEDVREWLKKFSGE
jgi:predicted DNA-binding transcriptional regulator AlpA